MGNRIPKDAGASSARHSTGSRGFWAWLKQDGNQKTLRFVGAAIAAAVALLVSVGIVRKPPADAAPQTPSPAVSLPQATAAAPAQIAPPSQSAIAPNGNAVNVNGNGNNVQAGKP